MNNRPNLLNRRQFVQHAGLGLAGIVAAGALPGVAHADKYPKLPAKPFGKGIFAHVQAGGKTREKPAEMAALAANPHVAGTQLSYSWKMLAPKEGEYRWDLIEEHMEVWAKAGKKCWIEVSTASKRDTADAGVRGAPDWVYQKGVPKIQAEGTAKYPVYWDPKYLELWGDFVHAFAKKFDGDPRIEFISTGGYSSGHEPNLSAWDNDKLMDQWKKAGFDGFTTTGVYLKKAIMPILTLFGDAFQKTPIAQTIHVKSEFDKAMNAYAAERKYILISNGMSVKANEDSRKLWRERQETLKTKVGYAEWGPTGRDLNLGGKNNRANAKMAKLLEAYQRVIGDDDDPKLRPSSKLSYVPLGQRLAEVETEKEWQEALKWASEHLAR